MSSSRRDRLGGAFTDARSRVGGEARWARLARLTRVFAPARIVRFALSVTVVGCAAAGLTGCSFNGAEPKPTTPTVDGAATYHPGGTAEENRAFFDRTNESFIRSHQHAGSRDLINNLTGAGFDRATLEVTADKTPDGNEVSSISFAARFGKECLIGERQDANYSSTIAPVTTGGTCLVGETLPIDW